MDTSTQELIECKECGGEGCFITDYNDPGDFYGHGQYETECEKCSGTGEVES